MAKSKFTPSSGKRNNIEYARSWPKTIKKVIGGVILAGILGYVALTFSTKKAVDYHGSSNRWQNRSKTVEKKVAEVGAIYIPLEKKSSKINPDSTKAINPNGLKKVTGRSFSEFANNSIETIFGDKGTSAYKEMQTNPNLSRFQIGFYVRKDTGAYTATLRRNDNGILELAILNFSEYDRYNKEKSSLEEMAKKAEEKANTELAKNEKLKENLKQKEGELTETKTTLQQTKKQVDAYANDEQKITNDYLTLANKYNFTSVNDESFPGLETKLKGDIKYNIEFRSVLVSGQERYEAVITHEKKNMLLAEKTRNLSFLKKYTSILTDIENAVNNFDAWKARPWIDGLTTKITPVENGLSITVETSSGKKIFERSNLKYRVRDLREELDY